MFATPLPRCTAVAVYRAGLELIRWDLEPEAAALLERLVTGMPFDSAVSGLGDGALEHIPIWFRDWVSAGLFTEIAAA